MKKIGTINETKQVLKDHQFHIKKHFGQNFIVDQTILDHIVTESGIGKNTNVIEIGPGLGSLTEKLLEVSNHVLAYEIDRDLIPILQKTFKGQTNFTLINQDILKADIDEDIKRVFSDSLPVIVISNLPYYITTPILMRFLETSKLVKKMIFMVQWEVGKRITSTPDTKDYNALSVVIQYRANTSILFKVPRTVFIPAPEVDSALIKIEVKDKMDHLPKDEDFFFTFVHQCFVQRRKTLANNLLAAYPSLSRETIENALVSSDLDVRIRSEALSVDQMIDLSSAFFHLLSK